MSPDEEPQHFVLIAETGYLGVALTQPTEQPPPEPEEDDDGLVQ